MKLRNFYLFIASILMLGGCSRCKEEVDPATDCNSKVGLDTTLKVYNGVLGRVLGAANLLEPELRTVASDTIWTNASINLIHQNQEDSVLWLLEGEQTWRKGDSIEVFFPKTTQASSVLIRKRVYGDRKRGCSKILIPFYELSRRFPVAPGPDTFARGEYEGFTTDGNKRRIVSLYYERSTGFHLLNLIDTWPPAGESPTYYIVGWYGGTGIKFFETDYSSTYAKGLQGYAYFIGRDSLKIDYSYGQVPQKVYRFTGRRKY